MTFRTLDLSTENSAFFSLSTIEVTDKYLPVPNKAFPVELKNDVGAVYYGLTGRELDDYKNTVLAHYTASTLRRIYGPRVYLNGGSNGFVIRWGDEYIELRLEDDGTFSPIGETVPNEYPPLEIAEAQVGKFTNLCLQGAVETNDDAILTFSFPIALVDYENKITAKAVTTLLRKRGFEAIAGNFAQVPSGEGGDDSPVYKTNINLKSGRYNILDWTKGVSKSGNDYCLVVLQNPRLKSEDGEDLPEVEQAKFWAPKKLQQSINAGLVLEGAEFEKVDLDNDKFAYEIYGNYELDEGGLDLSWL